MDGNLKELQSGGLLGIYQETFDVIFSWKNIFSQIILSFILPISLLFLGSTIILFHHTNASHPLPYFWPFAATYITFLLVSSSLLATPVSYTVACNIYSGRGQELTFKKLLTIVTKVWKRQTSNISLRGCIAIFIYFTVVTLSIAGWGAYFMTIFDLHDYNVLMVSIVLTGGVLHFMGLVYVSLIWQMAGVVSVLEELQGVQASITKSAILIDGKIGTNLFIFVKIISALAIIPMVFDKMVVVGGSLDMGTLLYGIICILSLLQVILFEIVAQTLCYLICKSQHNEKVNVSKLLDDGGEEDERNIIEVAATFSE